MKYVLLNMKLTYYLDVGPIYLEEHWDYKVLQEYPGLGFLCFCEELPFPVFIKEEDVKQTVELRFQISYK